MSAQRRSLRNEEGQAIVEFALVLPILALVLFSVLHFGKAFNYWNDTTHITAEGARFAAVNRKPDPADPATLQDQLLQQGVTQELRGDVDSASIVEPAEVCISFPNSTQSAGDPVEVKITFSYAWLPLIGDRIGVAQTTITSTSVMRLEAAPTVFTAGCSGDA